MEEQEQKLLKLKAQAFDRILACYRNLQNEAGFYSKNWVELSEVIEEERRRIKGGTHRT